MSLWQVSTMGTGFGNLNTCHLSSPPACPLLPITILPAHTCLDELVLSSIQVCVLAEWGCSSTPWRSCLDAFSWPHAQRQWCLYCIYELHTHSPAHTVSTLPAQNCWVVNNLDLAMTQPLQDWAQTPGGQHPPLVRGEPRFCQKLILEIVSSSLQTNGWGMILKIWMVQYSFWKLKGPNSSPTGVHVVCGRRSLVNSRPGCQGKEYWYQIQKAEGRILGWGIE